jgi:lipoic acid synthetase
MSDPLGLHESAVAQRDFNKSLVPEHAPVAAGRHPVWLRRTPPRAGRTARVESELGALRLNTVCSEARCPNRAECHSRGTATFLILGDTCTRGCAFCAVKQGTPGAIDEREPERVCQAVMRLGLRYVVITSVTRDDCPDGGASIFARTITTLHDAMPGIRIEVLVPDFKGVHESLETVLAAGPDVLNHNIETVPRLYPEIRAGADYRRSLNLLAQAKGRVRTKSGIMVGLGESVAEVKAVMQELAVAGCSVLTIGQYLRPSDRQVGVKEYVAPELFTAYEQYGREVGFEWVVSGPFVRSSYRADQIFQQGSPK